MQVKFMICCTAADIFSPTLLERLEGFISKREGVQESSSC